MPYTYEEHRNFVFTEDGQELFLKIRDRIKELLDVSGACRVGNVINCISEDTWNMLACIDRLSELGEIREIIDPNSSMGKHRVFVSAVRG